MRNLFALIVIAALFVGCSGNKSPKNNEATAQDAPAGQEEVAVSTTEMPDLSTITFESGPEGLEYHVIESGNGPQVENGQTAIVHYTGWLMDGRKFDSSRDRGQSFSFVVGQGRVIRGWEIGVGMMKVGDRWLLKLPSAIAYGEGGAGGVIPPGATLLFDVEVLETK